MCKKLHLLFHLIKKKMATPSAKFTYDSFVKLIQEVQNYDDYVPNALSVDQDALKKLDDKLIPFALQEALKRTVVIKEANGKNRERFLDTVVLNYPRLQNGSDGLSKTKEVILMQLNDIRNSFADVVKSVPATDSTTAARIELAMKNVELLTPLVKALDEAAMKASLDTKLTEKPAVIDATKPTLLGNALIAAMDSAVKSGAVTDGGLIGSALALLAPTTDASGTTLVTVENNTPASGGAANGGLIAATPNTSLSGTTTNVRTPPAAGAKVVPPPPKVNTPPPKVTPPPPAAKAGVQVATEENWWTNGRIILAAVIFLAVIVAVVLFVLSRKSQPTTATTSLTKTSALTTALPTTTVQNK